MFITQKECILKPFNPIEQQRAYYNWNGRFCTVPAGRRGGKTELACRKVLRRSLLNRGDVQHYFLGGPTYKHAKRLYWERIKRMLKDLGIGWMDKSEVDLMVSLPTNTEIWIMGFNEPDRFDGVPWNGGVVDEFADMNWEVWSEHIRPAMVDTQGWCDFIGVPAGRNHYWRLHNEFGCNPAKSHWASFTWWTEEVLPIYLGEEAARIEIEQAESDLDPKTFKQEFRGSFETFAGLAYYQFNKDIHASYRQKYDPKLPLNFCFDFNVEPGVANVIQEQKKKTRSVDEVYIPNNSNTLKICDVLISRYRRHKGYIYCYGDPSGGDRGTAKVAGSDWELIKQKLKPIFKDRLIFRVKRQHPPVIARLNSVNSRMQSVSGEVRYFIDPANCPMTIRDFEGVRSDSAGGIMKHKEKDKNLTHMSDAIGYYIEYNFPVQGRYEVRNQQI